jgi:hypothetical protein
MMITVKQKHRLRRRLKDWRSTCPKDLAVVITRDYDLKMILKNTEHEQD